jgi:hypothetical protein
MQNLIKVGKFFRQPRDSGTICKVHGYEGESRLSLQPGQARLF